MSHNTGVSWSQIDDAKHRFGSIDSDVSEHPKLAYRSHTDHSNINHRSSKETRGFTEGYSLEQTVVVFSLQFQHRSLPRNVLCIYKPYTMRMEAFFAISL